MNRVRLSIVSITALLLILIYAYCHDWRNAIYSTLAHSPFDDRTPCQQASDQKDDQSRFQRHFRVQLAQRKALLRQANQTYQAYQLHMLPQIECPMAVRLGSLGDGGKWVCNPWRLPQSCSVYSLGIAGDTSFEQELYRITDGRCRFTCVDENPVELGLVRPFLGKYLVRRLSNVTKPGTGEVTLYDLIQQADPGIALDVLKTDIEGSEFDVLSPFFDRSDAPRPCQLLLEMHSNKGTEKRWGELLSKLERIGYLLFYKEANPWCLQCTELAFIHEMCLMTYGLRNQSVIVKYFS